ncbi:TFIIB-type zinc ribbon-containing protein [Aquifex sp.]
MSENCPKCGALLLIVECCGGGIWYCENCKEYYYYGELIEPDNATQIPPEVDSQEDDPQPS